MRLFPALLPIVLAVPVPALAQGASPPSGLSEEVAREAATAAVAACTRLGYRTMATVVDSDGRPVATMTADARQTRALAPDSLQSARIAAYFHIRSSRVPDKLMEEASVSYAIRDHPELAPLTPGGIPLAGATTLDGGIGVAGAPDGDKDEECALAGEAEIMTKLR